MQKESEEKHVKVRTIFGRPFVISKKSRKGSMVYFLAFVGAVGMILFSRHHPDLYMRPRNWAIFISVAVASPILGIGEFIYRGFKDGRLLGSEGRPENSLTGEN